MKLVDVKRKGDQFQVFIKDENSKWVQQKNTNDILQFHLSNHPTDKECPLCIQLKDTKKGQIKSRHVISFLKNVIDKSQNGFYFEDFESFFYPARNLNLNEPDSASCTVMNNQNPKENPRLSITVSNPKPKYSDELVEELHRIKNQLALQDSFAQQDKFMEVKIKHQNHHYILMLGNDSTFEDLVKKMKRKMAIDNDEPLRFVYKDEEEDLIIVEDEEDFSIAVNSKMEQMFLALEIFQ